MAGSLTLSVALVGIKVTIEKQIDHWLLFQICLVGYLRAESLVMQKTSETFMSRGFSKRLQFSRCSRKWTRAMDLSLWSNRSSCSLGNSKKVFCAT